MSINGRVVRKGLLGAVLCMLMLAEPPLLVALVGVIKPITRIVGALSEKEIIKLSILSKTPGGTKQVGKILGNLRLPDEIRGDTYLRIAIHQGTILRREAEEIYSSLSKVSGFSTTLRKIIGNSLPKTKGHLNELRIANEASKHGFEVMEIGKKFDDPIKKASADIDVILRKKDILFPMEVKDYDKFKLSDMNMLRRDMDTLVAFKKRHSNVNPDDSVTPVFTITNRPTNHQLKRLMLAEAQKRGVQLIFGAPLEQIEKIKLLESII